MDSSPAAMPSLTFLGADGFSSHLTDTHHKELSVAIDRKDSALNYCS